MRVSVLGPVEVSGDGGPFPVKGSLVRRLLVRLAVDAPRAVSTTELTDAVWYDAEPPAQAANALQSLVSRLRRAMGRPDAVQQVPSGYRLVGCDVDIAEFERYASTGRLALTSGSSEEARSILGAALDLWTGPALLDAGDAEYAIGVIARLNELHVEVVSDRIDADLAEGAGGQLVAELQELTSAMPLRERLAGQHMVALTRVGRSAEALAVFARIRERLADELGADPSQSLQDVHLAILRGEEGNQQELAPSAMRHALRGSLTTFVGREAELKRIHGLFAAGRLTTVVGPGGAGKTRLAGEAIRTWQPPARWDGDWLIELAPITEEANLTQAFLSALGVREARMVEGPVERPLGRDPLTRLIDALRDMRCLLVVDNCEHLVTAVATLLARLLGSCPDVRVLATSREPIGIDGESLCVVPPLALPDSEAGPEEAVSFPAVQLFTDRAAAVSADFEVDDSNVSDVVEIVRRLDGLPLAIELAAARLRVLPVDEVAARLSDRFRLLTGGNRAAMPRHRTLRAVVEWSWELLTPGERLLAERLAVFPSGASVASAVAVCGGAGIDPADVPETLDSLVDKSLLHVITESGLRYRMLETIREYGIERLVERGDVDAVRFVHARHFAAVAAEMAPLLRAPNQLQAFAVIEQEQGNLVAALRFLGDSGAAPEALELAIDLSWYWMLRNEHADAHAWISFAAGVPGGEGLDLHVLAEAGMVLNELASLENFDVVGEPAGRKRLLDIADDLRGLTDLTDRCQPLRAIMVVALGLMSGDDEFLDRVFDESLLTTDPWTEAAVRTLRAAVSENRGDIAQMREDVGSALTSFRTIGDRWGIATALASEGYIAMLDGRLEASSAAYEEASCLMEELGARADGGFMRLRLASLRVRQGRYDEARMHVDAVIESLRGRSDAVVTFATVLLASIAAVEGDEAAKLHYRDEVLSQLELADPDHPADSHGRAISFAVLAQLYADDGDTEEARRLLTAAYPVSLSTRDQPIIAIVGVSVAITAARLGATKHAAEVLGAAAALRGGDDPTDPLIATLRARLEGELGERFSEHYDRGKALSPDDAKARVDPGLLAELTRA